MTAPGLDRRLGLGDAVVVGLGSMLGAGVFAAFGPAAAAAGSGLLVGLGLAALVAYANATSTAQLAARHPMSGGAYLYGREQLGATWGFLAGWGFVVGKTASCAAMALTFGAYAWPEHPKVPALAAVAVLTAVNYRGIAKTAALTRVLVALTLLALAAVVTASVAGGQADAGRLADPLAAGGAGVLESAALLFFAFAGYARIATLGEEVRDPARTIPRAVPLALAIAVAVYAAVGAAALAAVGPDALAAAEAPLAAAAESGSLDWLAPAVRAGGAVAAAGVLLSLLAGIGRTTLAMARERDLPATLAAVHPRYRVPHRAEVVLGLAVAAIVAVADVRGAIGFSSFTVLTYYLVANAAALTLPGPQRRWLAPVAALGAAGCVLLAFALPAGTVVGGAGVLAAGIAIRALTSRVGRPRGGRLSA